MARAETVTWLGLDEWARVMGYDLWEFNGFSALPCNVSSSCGTSWYQTPEQGGNLSREELAIAIQSAEVEIAEYVNFNLLPDWDIATVTPERYYRPEYTSNFAVGARVGCYTEVKGKSVQLPKRWVRGIGIKAKEFLGNYPITRIDKDGDGFMETGQVSVSTDIDYDEIKIYYPDENGDDSWEIRPIKLSGRTVIEFPMYLVPVKSQFMGMCADALDPENEDNFLTTVDVYHVYNDSSVLGTLNYTNGCSTVKGENCVTVTDSELGYVSYNYNFYPEPDSISLSYYSGWENSKGNRTKIDPYWATPISYLAISLVDRMPHNCDGGNTTQLVSRWTEDLAEITDIRRFYISEFQNNNPFMVTTRGAYYAYGRAVKKRIIV